MEVFLPLNYSVQIVVVFVIRDFIANVIFLIWILLVSGDVELNPGPGHPRQRKCRLLYCNIRGLHANIKDLTASSKSHDILFCSETLVSNMRHVSELLIPGFKKPILLRRDAIPRARGMAVYVRNGYSASKTSYACTCHEMQVMKVCGKQNNFYLFSLYRNPDLDNAIFDCLLLAMAKVQEDDRKACFVFVGDLNAHHRQWLSSVSPTDCHGIRAYDFACESGCEQVIREPTHSSGNCLDLVFTDSPGVVTGTVAPPVGTSDHCAISIAINIEQPSPNITHTSKVFIKSQADWDNILNDLSQITWPEIYKEVEAVRILNDNIVSIIDRRIPFRIIRYRTKDKAWFNDDCRRAHMQKQEAYNLWNRNRSAFLWDNYVHYRAAAQRVYNSAEVEYNTSTKGTLQETANSYKFWTTLKSALFGNDSSIPPLLKPDGSITHSPEAKATLLADVFDGKQSNENLTLPDSCFPEPRLSKLAFRSSEVKKLLLDLDAYGGTDPNGIFPLFFKKTAEYLAPKLSVIFRKLARSGSFCECWRIGNITPLCKCACGSFNPTDYRPISITPVLSKIFERLLAKRLSAFAEHNRLFPLLQFGFRKGLGTCDALLTISTIVQRSLDSGQEVRLVGLDFSAAFDRVNHKALIFKLRQLGVGGVFLNIIRQFLTNRRQKVNVDNSFSDEREVISGVPQGSVLGPLLFILYTHDMWFGLENKLIAYADDATLIAPVPSPELRASVAESLNRDLAKINYWCTSWGMKLNAKKTQSIIVSRSRTPDPPHPDLLINDIPVSSCDSFKLLGVMLDSKFTFEDHIRSISSSISQKIGILRKSYKVFGEQDILKKCFNAFILPCFEYCAPVWSSAANSHLNLLDRNLRAIKFLIPDLNVDLWHRRAISSLCILYKIIHNADHPLHQDLPNFYAPQRVTRIALNSNSRAFTPMRFNTTQYSRSFIPNTTKLWNGLPSVVVESSDMQNFKVGANAFLGNRIL